MSRADMLSSIDNPSIGLKKAEERQSKRKAQMEKFVPLPGKKGDKLKPVPLPGKKGDELGKPVLYKSGGTIKPTTMKKQKTAPKSKMSAKEMEAMKKGKAPMMKYGGKMGKKPC